MQNADNIAVVRPKVAGAVYVAAEGTTVPTDASTALKNFNSLGWLNEDGITMNIDRETNDLIGFGGDVMLTIQESHDLSFTITPTELNEQTVSLMYGSANVDKDETSGAITGFKVNSEELDKFAMVIDLRGRNGQLIRICVPVAQITETGELPLKHNEAMASEWTIKAYPDSNNNKAYIYIGAEE